MRFLQWFYPGLRLKRWLVIFIIGVLFTAAGTAYIFRDVLAGCAEAIPDELFTELFGQNGPLIGAFCLLVLGLSGIVISLREILKLYIRSAFPEYPRNQIKSLYQRHYLKRGPRVVVIGGGTGLSVLLRGLKEHTSNITAVVSVTDDGGSSGRLRGEFGILPPGDLRNCLVALADTEPAMENLFNYRFKKGVMSGHNLGNLLITAMADMSGSFETAIHEVSKVLAIRGRVIPSTLDSVMLAAELQDGSKIMGESNITKSPKAIKRVFTIPNNSQPLPDALEAILEADAVVLGPGSLYTSVIPNLLVPGIVEAIQKSRGVKIYVCNIMTQPGETQGYSASDHLKAIYRHSVPGLVEYIIVNNEDIPEHYRKKYASEGACAVEIDGEKLRKLQVKTIAASLFQEKGYIRHHSQKLAYFLIKQILESKGTRTFAGLIDQYLLPDTSYKQGS